MPFRIVGLPPRDSTTEMILTQCAVCATELGLSLGKKCASAAARAIVGLNARCSTGKRVATIISAENKESRRHRTIQRKYEVRRRPSAFAVEKCAEQHKGQTCYICAQALHWKTKEGLVRGCSCRGTAGFVHVSCLAEQAKILVAEAERTIWTTRR